MLYPLILLIGMIPFIGAVGATILIFFAFLLALISFMFIIACAWICARPFLAIIIFGFIGVLILLGKEANQKMHENGMIKDEPQRVGRVDQKFLTAF